MSEGDDLRLEQAGYLTRVLPKVYAVGHTAPSREADLWAAVLYAGPGAMLSHASAAHHRGLIIYPPDVIHVSTPRVKIRSIRGVIQVHPQRELARGTHEGIPTTTVAQTLLDLAASRGLQALAPGARGAGLPRRARHRAIETICGKGRAGSKALRKALAGPRARARLTYQRQAGGGVPLFYLWRDASHHTAADPGSPVQPGSSAGCGSRPGRRLLAAATQPRCSMSTDGDLADRRPIRARVGHQILQPAADPSSCRAAVLHRSSHGVTRAHGLQVVRYDWPLVKGAAEEVGADLLRQLAAASLTR